MGNSEPNANPNPAAEQRKGSYKGNCDDLGRSSGQGFMKYADGSTFEGNFEEGLPENGTFLYPNGCKYVGHLR